MVVDISSRLPISIPEIEAFCRRNCIRRLALFGSVLREDFGPTSDLDILVEFEQGHVPGFAFFSMQDELSQILGRRVDLNTPRDLSPLFREEVVRGTEVVYADT